MILRLESLDLSDNCLFLIASEADCLGWSIEWIAPLHCRYTDGYGIIGQVR